MLGGTVDVRRAFDFDKIARLVGSEIRKQINLPCLLKHVGVNLHIRSVTSHPNTITSLSQTKFFPS